MKFYSFFSFNWFKYLLENLLFFFLVLLHHFTISAIQFSLFRTSINLRLICPLHLTFSLPSFSSPPSLFLHPYLIFHIPFFFHPSLFLQPSILLRPPSFSALLSFSILSPSPSSPHFPPSSPLRLSPLRLFSTLHHIRPLLLSLGVPGSISAHYCCFWEYLDLYPPTVAVSGSTWIYIPPLFMFLGVP